MTDTSTEAIALPPDGWPEIIHAGKAVIRFSDGLESGYWQSRASSTEGRTTEFVRADMHDTLAAERDALREKHTASIEERRILQARITSQRKEIKRLTIENDVKFMFLWKGKEERDALRSDLASLKQAETDAEAERDRLRAWIAEFAAAGFDPLPLPPKGHPEDEVEPVTDAQTVWAWQEEAEKLLKGGANG